MSDRLTVRAVTAGPAGLGPVRIDSTCGVIA